MSLHEYPPIDAPDHHNTISRIFKSHLSHSHFPWNLYLCCLHLCSDYFLHSSLFHCSLSFPISYFPTPSSYKPFHMPLSNSQPIQVALLSTSQVYTLYTLIITTPAILIAVKGLPSYQVDITCQLLVQLLITSHLYKSSISKPAQTTYLTPLASHFTLSSHSCLNWSSNCYTPTSSTTTWKSSPLTSSIQLSIKSTSPSLEQNNNTTVDRQGLSNRSLTPPPPFPWPFESPTSHFPYALHSS